MNLNLMVSSDCEPTSASGALALTRLNGETQMTKMKALSAVIILSAAIATPVFAQGTTHHSRALDRFRGTYNQFNGPSYAVPDAQDRRNIEDFGFSGRDPSRPGGEDPSLNPSGS
jgi:hypothetical protein